MTVGGLEAIEAPHSLCLRVSLITLSVAHLTGLIMFARSSRGGSYDAWRKNDNGSSVTCSDGESQCK